MQPTHPYPQPGSSQGSTPSPNSADFFTAADRFQQYGLDPDVYSDPRPQPMAHRSNSHSTVLVHSNSRSPVLVRSQSYSHSHPYPAAYPYPTPAAAAAHHPHPGGHAYAYDPAAAAAYGLYPHAVSQQPQPGASTAMAPHQMQQIRVSPAHPYVPYYQQQRDDAGGLDDDYGSYASSSPPPSDPEPGEGPSDASGRGGAGGPQRRPPLVDQPLTVDGRPRERVWVACDRCRVRKLGCDGARPSCSNCLRAGEDCKYDPLPRRRGQDRLPRTRSANGTRRERKKTTGGGQRDTGAGTSYAA